MRLVIESWSKKFNKLVPGLRRAALKLGRLLGRKEAAVEIYLVGGSFMEKNVLAFPAPKGFPRPDIKGRHLGEIYLNPDYIEKHSENLIYMLIHGFLHLLDYDHINRNDRIRMQKKESFLLKKL